MNLLWVGKLDFRKQIILAVEILGKLKDLDVVLHVCGGGSEEQVNQMKKHAERLGVSTRLKYHGMISHDEVQKMMLSSDLLLFTSIMEGTPHVVLEAIANNLPVICLDTCGQGDCVTEKVGRKIPLSSPVESVEKMASAIRELFFDRPRLKELSDNCYETSLEMSWNNKADTMFQVYKNYLFQ